MTILDKKTKQSGETMDYDIYYTDFFSTRTDTPSTATATVDTGITLVSAVMNTSTKIVKVTLSGGTVGITYKATVQMTTSTGIIKEDEFTVTIKDT